MSDLTFYSNEGAPIAYTEDGKHIFSFEGEPLGYFKQDSIHNFGGKHLGWYQNGWIFDHDGLRVFFTERASGGPTTPRKLRKPMKSMKQMKPMKGMTQMEPRKPRWSQGWSELSSEIFFHQ